MIKTNASLILVLVLISGCQNMGRGNQTQAQATYNAINQKLNAGYQQGNECFNLARSTPVGQKVDQEVLYQDPNNPKRLELASSKAKLNKSQKQALNSYIQEITPCRNPIYTATNGLPQQGPTVNFYSKIDQIYIGLLSGDMNIGEANKKKMALVAEYQTALNNANAQLQQSLNNAHNQEVEQRQRNAAMMLNYLQGQQVINQNQQLLNQNQQAIMNQNRPINTNCNRYGNSVNCTTY